ncbi:hypothetical protein SDJN03_29065, partial [Cucurbita argyrosperma subsp. sororia]
MNHILLAHQIQHRPAMSLWNSLRSNRPWSNRNLNANLGGSVIRTPTAKVHDRSQRFLGLMQLLAGRGSHGGGKLLGLRNRPNMVFGVVVGGSYEMVPPADSLILEGLHDADAGCHNQRSC